MVFISSVLLRSNGRIFDRPASFRLPHPYSYEARSRLHCVASSGDYFAGEFSANAGRRHSTARGTLFQAHGRNAAG
jgi:hypothetical protein